MRNSRSWVSMCGGTRSRRRSRASARTERMASYSRSTSSEVRRAPLAERARARSLPQDLVAVGVADAGHETLVAQQRLQLAGVAPDALAEGVEGELRIVGVRAHLRPAGDLVEPARSTGRACRASRGRRTGAPPPSVKIRRRPVRARTFAGPVDQKRPASMGLAARSVPRVHRAATGGGGTCRGRAGPGMPDRARAPRRGPEQDRRRSGGSSDLRPVARRSSSSATIVRSGSSGTIGPPLTRMVCYAGRVAEQPHSVRERVYPSVRKEHRVVFTRTAGRSADR